jgi:outer membrane receptor protein involved in Fe transport
MRNYLLILVLFLSAVALGQSSKITGNVTKLSAGVVAPMIGANVSVADTDIVVPTDAKGNYSINIEPGNYKLYFSFIGYAKDSAMVVVTAGQTAVANITMVPSALTTKNIVFVVKRPPTTKALIADIKKQDNAVSGTGANEIAKNGDGDAAKVATRIPGVTVIDKFITIRGLNDRYTSVWLNNAAAPGAETDKRAFSFDIIPGGVIEKMLVFKTPSAELPGDFAGGMVKIFTRSIPEKTSFSFDLKGSYRPGSTFNTFNFSQRSSTDWMGFDNGYRSLPAGLNPYVSKNDANNSAETKSFNNNWAMQSSKAMPDLRLNLYYNQLIKVKKATMGNVFAINYSNSQTVFDIQRQDWDSTDITMNYLDQQFTRTVRTNILENFGFEYKGLKMELKNLLNQTGTEQTVFRNGLRDDAPNEKAYMYSYQAKTTYTGQFTGQYQNKDTSLVYSWSAGYAYINRNDPDLRRIKYTKNQGAPDSMYKAQVANVVDPVNGGGRFFAKLTENVYSFNHALKYKVKLKKYSFETTVGTYFEQKNRAFAARILGYTIKPGANAFNWTRYDLGTIFSDPYVGVNNGFKIDEITSMSDKYEAQNQLLAGFAQLALPVGKKIKVVGGVRYEYNKQSLQSHVNLDSVSPQVITKFVLPSVNATYNFNEKSLLRLAYGKTLNRPEFREWSPFFFYDFNFNAGTYGSLFPTVISPSGSILKVAEIQNYDFRYEFYPSATEMIHVGAFYKTFINPIQQVVLSAGGDSRAFTFVNGESAYARGVELDVRKNLVMLDTLLKSNFFSNLSFVGNLALTQSALSISKTINQASTMPMQGQSPYVVNAGLYYQNDSIGFQLNVMYNVFGPRVFLLGTLDYPSIGELPRNTLDINISKKISKHFSVNLLAQDVLNNPVYMVQDSNKDGVFSKDGSDKLIVKYYRGPYITLGLKGTF